MIRVCGGIVLALLLSGCVSIRGDKYPATWTETNSQIDPVRSYMPTSDQALGDGQERCYVVIEHKLPTVEICKQGAFISYNPLSARDVVSIVPPEISAVLVLQGHMRNFTSSATQTLASADQPHHHGNGDALLKSAQVPSN